MLEAATVEVVEDAATGTWLGELWLSRRLVLLVVAPNFVDLCRQMQDRLAEVLDEVDRHHEDWPSSRPLLEYRRRPLRFVDSGRSPPR